MRKIAVIVNKNWEVEPLLAAMTGSELKPSALPFPQPLNSPLDKSVKIDHPRATFTFSRKRTDNSTETSLIANVWCIQDLMSADKNSSSSEEKFRVLPKILAMEDADLVIAVGTAGYPNERDTINGSVVIGANFFLHDGDPGNPESNLSNEKIDGPVLASNVTKNLFDFPMTPFTRNFKSIVEAKMLRTPRNPAVQPVCMASKVFTAISSVNVTDYAKYNWVDQRALELFKNNEPLLPASSLETTHGVIKLSTNSPIIFMSAITDRLHAFDLEVLPTQNFTASFNAGIVLAELLCSLNDWTLSGASFNVGFD